MLCPLEWVSERQSYADVSKAVNVGTGRKDEETGLKVLYALNPFNNPMNFRFFYLFGM